MDSSRTSRLTRRGLAPVVLASALGAALLGLSQCRMIDERVTGPDPRDAAAHQISTCIRECQEAYKACRDAEQERYREALRQCDELPREERKACRDAENVRHDTEKEACKSAWQQCRSDCEYREGSGTAGR